MAGIGEFLEVRPSVTEVTNALVGAFQARFGIDFKGLEG
jgi:hypothetical protein